jgi:MinD-like ATPase involved in chromosome partitioning or flagellar assembly
MLQLPTDRIVESDLARAWRDPRASTCCSPHLAWSRPRRSRRDMEKDRLLLRRIYNIIVVTHRRPSPTPHLPTPRRRRQHLSIITPTATRWQRPPGGQVVAAGLSPHKMMLVMNRAGSPGIKPEQMAAELGRLPDVAIPDDQPLVKATSAEGVPFVLAQPKAKASQQIMELAQRLTAPPESSTTRSSPALSQSLP